MAAILGRNPDWQVPSYETVYSWPDGRKVWVYDAALIDSLGLRGWNDITVQYPINENDSNVAHIVHLHDSELAN